MTPSDLVIYEVLPNPNTESDKDAEYIKLFNPSNVDTIYLDEYQVYDATSNRYIPLTAKTTLGPREYFVLCRNKAWFDDHATKRPSGASDGCDQQGRFVLHDRLSTVVLQRKDGEISGTGIYFYEDIDSVQIVDATSNEDKVYARISDAMDVKTECATCFQWAPAYYDNIIL